MSPNRVMDSNGPDMKVRGSAAHITEKYRQLARDANAAGDRIAAENYLQHAEHYHRLLAGMQEHAAQQRSQHQSNSPQPNGRDDRRGGSDRDGGTGQEHTSSVSEPEEQTNVPASAHSQDEAAKHDGQPQPGHLTTNGSEAASPDEPSEKPSKPKRTYRRKPKTPEPAEEGTSGE